MQAARAALVSSEVEVVRREGHRASNLVRKRAGDRRLPRSRGPGQPEDARMKPPDDPQEKFFDRAHEGPRYLSSCRSLDRTQGRGRKIGRASCRERGKSAVVEGE